MTAGQGYDPGFLTTWVTVTILFCSLYYAYAYVIFRIGRRFNVGSYVDYCIPVYRTVLLCRCAGITGWFAVGLLIPYLNILVSAYLFAKLAARMNKNRVVFGMMGITFVLPLLLLSITASRSPFKLPERSAEHMAKYPEEPVEEPSAERRRAQECPQSTQSVSPTVLYLYCTDGEHRGGQFMIPPQGLLIGRDPRQVNIVLNEGDISDVHAAVCPSSEGDDAVMLTDMKSSTGTYYYDPQSAAWYAVQQPILLRGRYNHRFCIGYPGAEFMVAVG